MRFINYAFGTLLGVGFFPYAPGTVASLVSLIIYYFIDINFDLLDYQFNILLLLLFFAGVASGNFIERDRGKKDPKFVVIDETLGLFVTFWGIDVFQGGLEFYILGAGFFLFRFFDILKPYPVNVLDNVRGGLGIMSDDFVAGIISNFILKVLLFAWKVFY